MRACVRVRARECMCVYVWVMRDVCDGRVGRTVYVCMGGGGRERDRCKSVCVVFFDTEEYFERNLENLHLLLAWYHECNSHLSVLLNVVVCLLKFRYFTFTYPLTAGVVSSTFSYSPLLSGTWRTPGLSFPKCCLPTSSSVCLVFFPLSLCLASWFWPDLMNGTHVHTTSVCVSLRWSGGLRVVRY